MKEITQKFQKLHINSFCELALLIPSSYEDYRIYTHLRDGSFMVLDVTIEHLRQTPSSLQLTLFAHNLGYTLQGVVFKPKRYMLHQFQQNTREYLYGKVQCKGGFCSLVMPKKISSTLIGQIIPIYKTALRTDVMRNFVQKHLTLENLLGEGLPEYIAQTLLSIHFPKTLPKELTKEQLYALKFCEAFYYIKELKKKKTTFPALSSSTQDISSWIKTLPFELTKEQKNAIDDIRNDLTKPTAAKRLVVGDVGCGKTMVILATALLNAPRRSILLAPTTILAQQLFEEAQKFLPQLRCILVTNKTKKTLSLQEYDFIIGTHALLYREIPDATVVMVDEQHRFGTKQRNLLTKLLQKGEKKPHFFQFSATPIPRTQAMIESHFIDISLITSTPFKKDITTSVIHKKDFPSLLQHIKREIEKKHQVLIIYPLVNESDAISYQSIEEARAYWEKHFNNVYVTHGKDKEKEQVLLEFKEKGSILLATTVVEVGISLPRLSTIIIVGAERLGLATLHQLRGRVSRNGLKGYCFLYTNQESSKRLEAFCQTTNGFEIAELDLATRDSGDLLKGEVQSGKQFTFLDLSSDKEIIQKVQQLL